MQKLSRENLYSLEKYATIRPEFRARVMEHKDKRRVAIGEHAALYFEDTLTMQYQVQEMLRLERIFEAEGIQEELDVYNPLIPDGSNWKATFMIEYYDVDERKRALSRLVGIEDKVWLQVAGHEKVFAIANEDLDRSTPDKTAAVHFMRFELTPAMISAVKQGAKITAGTDHPQYLKSTVLPVEVAAALAQDLH